MKKANILTGVLLASSLVLFSISLLQNNERVGATSLGTTTAILSEENMKIITATGTGVMEVVPDIAYVNLGVITENKDLSKAQTENATKMNKIMTTLKDLGIKETEIKTSNYDVSPKYNWNNDTGESKITGFTISNSVKVTIKDIDKTENLLDKVLSSGGNNVKDITFGVKDESTLYNKALELAVKDAKSKASAMGKGLSIYDLNPVKITETNNYNGNFYTKNTYMDAVESSTPVSQGTLEVSASVSIDFQFR